MNGVRHPRANRHLQVQPGVSWIVEEHHLLLRDGGGSMKRIDYPQAAVWDLASRGYRTDQIAGMMVHIAELDREAAERLVDDTLHEWVELGYLSAGT